MDRNQDNADDEAGQEPGGIHEFIAEMKAREAQAEAEGKRPWHKHTIPWSGRDKVLGLSEFEGPFKYNPADHAREDRLGAWLEVMKRMDRTRDIDEMLAQSTHVDAFLRYLKVEAKKEGKPLKNIITPTATGWVDATKTKPRPWLYRPHYLRGFMSSSIAPGGIGKTSLGLVESLAMLTRTDVVGIMPHEPEPLNVWYWNGEDPREEMERRWAAVLRHYKVKPEDLKGKFYLDSGRDLKIKIAKIVDGDIRIAVPVVDAMIDAIQKRAIDVLHIDPFVSSHIVPENANEAMQQVAEQWAHIANKTDCAIELWHHSRKTGGRETTFEDGRGASAVGDAARGRRVLNKMSDEEATKAGLPTSARGRYFWVDHSGSSMIAPAESREWYKLESVNLHNGEDGLDGDEVGVVTAWEFTGATALDMTPDQRAAIIAAIREGGPWRAHITAKDWIGVPFARVLGADLKDKAKRKEIEATVADWLMEDLLEVYQDRHPDRAGRKVDYVRLTDQAEFG